LNSLRLADGLILTGNYPDPAILHWLLKENYPFVLIGRSIIPQNEIDTIVNDHEPSSYEATRHLIDLGHRHLGLVVDDLSLAYHQERLAGCQMAVAEASEARLTIFNRQVLAGATEFVATMRQNQVTALICADRKLVIPTINLLQEIPLQIPKDLSLVFLVSNTWDLPFANPTRVSLNRDVIGRLAVQRLVERLQGSLNEYRQIQVPCRFVTGTTTTPATIN
jgi:DNA-binding LacI/PurR family transcriptional regulator